MSPISCNSPLLAIRRSSVVTIACNYPLLAIRRSSVAPDDERPRSGRESRIAIVDRPEAPAGGGLFLNGNDSGFELWKRWAPQGGVSKGAEPLWEA